MEAVDALMRAVNVEHLRATSGNSRTDSFWLSLIHDPPLTLERLRELNDAAWSEVHGTSSYFRLIKNNRK